MRRDLRSLLLPACLFLLALVIAWLAYLPGLHGGFLFDDFANLPSLGAAGPVDNWPSFLRYITSGTADPTGRPLALLSFLADAHDWPAQPYPFKRTNLLLHLANAALLFILLSRLGREAVKGRNGGSALERRLDLAAALAAALWLLHPLLVSTTLYIVQREAMLPATCALAGMIFWLRGRSLIRTGVVRRGIALVAGSIGLFTMLGVLSKANGALLPLFVLAIEYTLLSPRASAWPAGQSAYRRIIFLFAGLPTALVLAYLAWLGWKGLAHGIDDLRPWTLGQRLLTEPRILFDYLRLLWVPRPFTSGVFNEQYKVSASLLDPQTTFMAVAGVLAMLAALPWLRKYWPAMAVAVAFYFSAHVLEATTVPLELYYEHRNYVPALFLFWPLALAIVGVDLQLALPRKTRPRINDVAAVAVSVLMVAGLAAMTWANSSLWGDTSGQALVWARMNPGSPRAQTNAAAAEMASGHPVAAMARLGPMLARDPTQIQVALNLVGAECQAGAVQPAALTAATTAIKSTRDPGTLLLGWASRAIDSAREGRCPGLDLAALDSIVKAGLDNPFFKAGRRQDIEHIRGNIALARGDATAALAYFNSALDEQPRIETALQQSATLGDAGHAREGLAHLDHFDSLRSGTSLPSVGMARVHEWVLERQDYWGRESRRLRANLTADARTPAPGQPSVQRDR